MRVGKSPNRGRPANYRPAKVTVCLLVSIPNQLGYYKHRLEILKICVESLVAHTPRADYDLLVFDNGSCLEVVNYLQSLRENGIFQYLILAAQNIGKVNAYKIMFQAAPGEIIAYSDDDVFFYSGWLRAHLDILETFPKVGMVSGTAVRSQFRYGNQYLQAYLREFPNIAATTGQFIPYNREKDFFRSTGGGEEEVQKTAQKYSDVLLEYRAIKAYSTATHFQFVAPKTVILRGLDQEWKGALVARGEKKVDERIDSLGYARLSTFDRYVRHLGNVVTSDMTEDIARIRLDREFRLFVPPRPFLSRLSRLRLLRAALRRLNDWSYFLLNYRDLG